jgi:hypothetical protein
MFAASLEPLAYAESQAAEVTFEDLRAGYWLNYEEFKTLFVAWRHVTLPLEAALRHQEEMWKSETPEQRAALRKADGHREEQNEFWTDRVAFQVRTPAVLVPDRDAPDRKFTFPLGAAHKSNLMTDFKEIAVYNFNGELADGVKLWNGVLEKLPQGAVLSRLDEMSPGKWLPPLAMREPVAGFILHPFDAFFSTEYESARVVERTALDGREVYLVEKVVTDSDGPRRMRILVEYDGGDVNKLLVQEVQRAWIDMQRGCLPLRIEFLPQWVYDGQTYFDAYGRGPERVTETRQIEKVPGGGFYPIDVRQVSYAIDHKIQDTFPPYSYSLQKIIRRATPKATTVPHSEQQWVAHAIEAGRDMTGLFGFNFPDGTVYFDFRTSKVIGRNYDEVQGRTGFAAGRRRGTAGSTTRWVLIGANVALVIALGALVIVRRVKGIRG